MVIQVVRKVENKKYEYWSIQYPDLHAYANNSIGGLLRNKIIVQHGNQVLYLDEDARASIILSKVFPFVPMPISWTIREKSQQVGSIKSVFMRPRKFLYFFDDVYEICGHSRGKYSLMKNGDQIAIWQRSRIPARERCHYRIECLEMEPLVSFLACVMCDRADYTGEGGMRLDDDWGDDYITFVPFDKWKARANWRPPLDESKEPPTPKLRERTDNR